MKKSRVVLLFTALVFSGLMITACGKKENKKSSEVELSVGSRSKVNSKDSTMDEDFDYLDDEDSNTKQKGKDRVNSSEAIDGGFTKKSESKSSKAVGHNKPPAKSQTKTSGASVEAGGKKVPTQKKQSAADLNASFEEYKKWLESRKSAATSGADKQSSSSGVVSSSQAGGSPQSSVASQSSVVSQSSQSPEKTQGGEIKKEAPPSSISSSSPVAV